MVAILVPAWWVGLYTNESFRALFVAPGEWDSFRAFAFADGGLALLTGVAGLRGLSSRLSPTTAALAVGAWGYATLWSIGATLSGLLPALGGALMGVALIAVAAACHALVSSGRADQR